MARKYQMIWENLKAARVVEIQLKHTEKLSPEQLAKQVRTLCRAVSKEKYEDGIFRCVYPHATITSETSGTGKVSFRLDLDPTNLHNIF